MGESGIMKCAPCIAYRGTEQANDAITIAEGSALCREHLVVLEIRGGGGKSVKPFYAAKERG